MMTWKEHLAHQSAEKKRLRDEWVNQAAALKMGVTPAARHLGIKPQKLQNEFSARGIKTKPPARTFVVAPIKVPKASTARQRKIAAMVAKGYPKNVAEQKAGMIQ